MGSKKFNKEFHFSNLIFVISFFLLALFSFNFPNSNYLIFSDNGADSMKIQLGRKLFYDPILSKNKTISCNSCHKQEFAFADTVRFNRGWNGKLLRKNTISLSNLINNEFFLWDGSLKELGKTIFRPIKDSIEMGNSVESLISSLNQSPDYPGLFRKSFGARGIDSSMVVEVMVAFLKSLKSEKSFFKLRMDSIIKASPEGMAKKISQENFPSKIINVLTLCEKCHSGSISYGGSQLKNNGLDFDYGEKKAPENEKLTDSGTLFKVPSLNNVALNAPYMHDGRFNTLEDVVEYYNSGIKLKKFLSEELKINGEPIRLNLDNEEKKMIVDFLKSLTDTNFIKNPDFGKP